MSLVCLNLTEPQTTRCGRDALERGRAVPTFCELTTRAHVGIWLALRTTWRTSVL